MYHILSASQFDLPTLKYIYRLTNHIRRFDKCKEGLMYLRGLLREKRAMLYFTQVSTRTFLSFQSACHVLGIQTLEIRDPTTSSEMKGESTLDSLRTFSSYADLMIIRSVIPKLSEDIAKHLDQTPRRVPIINAGSGPDEHPTQAVLDVYTLMRSFKGSNNINGKSICFVGDLKRSRTVRSLVQMLCLFKDVKFIFVSPQAYQIQDDMCQLLTSKGLEFTQTQCFEDAVSQADAIYITRIQSEYGEDEKCDPPIEKFFFKAEHLKLISDECVIMHPLPRCQELDTAVDSDPRAMYWRQERNGLWTRAALMTMILGVDNKIVLPELQ